MGKKLIVILTIAALGIFTLAAVGCAAVTDQRAAVSGIVVADGLAQEGTQVKQGDNSGKGKIYSWRQYCCCACYNCR